MARTNTERLRVVSAPSAVEFVSSDSAPAPDALCAVAITELKISRPGPAAARFLAAIPSVLRELPGAEGLVAHGVRVRASRLHFTTYAAFAGGRQLDAYLAAGAHGEVARALRGRLGSVRSVRLELPAAQLPRSWAQIDMVFLRSLEGRAGTAATGGQSHGPAEAAAERDIAAESVWDYPRPPRVEPTAERVEVSLGTRQIAETARALRVLETSHPPTYYIPFEDIEMASLTASTATSWCEFKGRAHYWDAAGIRSVGWSYPEPSRGYEKLREHLAFYPGRVRARVQGEPVIAQPGDFYGGWITSRVRGPFKGGPGTSGW